jgi:hypothetical protein
MHLHGKHNRVLKGRASTTETPILFHVSLRGKLLHKLSRYCTYAAYYSLELLRF